MLQEVPEEGLHLDQPGIHSRGPGRLNVVLDRSEVRIMSEKTRRKKDGHNTDKDRQAMRADVERRKEIAATSRAGARQPTRETMDKPDYMPHKPGSEEDHTMRERSQPPGAGH